MPDHRDQTRSPRTARTLTERILPRVAVVLLIAAGGLAVGTLAAPALRKHHYLRQLRSPEPADRRQALNILAGIARNDAGVAGPLADALLAEGGKPDVVAPETVERIAAWAIERSDAVHRQLGHRLDTTDDERFQLVADWLRLAGRWTSEHREAGDLVRRAVLGFSDIDARQRVAALEDLQQLGPQAGPFLDDRLPMLLEDSSAAVREAAVVTSCVCLDRDAAAATVLVPALGDSAAGVCRAAVIGLGLLQPEASFGADADYSDELVAEALLWGVARSAHGYQIAAASASDARAPVRAMAAWALGYVPVADESVAGVLGRLVEDEDPLVAARGLIALGRRGIKLDDVVTLVDRTGAESVDVRLAAVYALGRCAGSSGARKAAVTRLRGMLGDAIQQGEVTLATAAVESLGQLGDGPFLPVLLDMVEELSDLPLLQYAAACSALELDADAGAAALVVVCGADQDEARELAAFRLGRLAEPPVRMMSDALVQGGDPLRGGAALALALAGDCRAGPDEPLLPWLRARLQPADALFEHSWRIRCNYESARLLCGDSDAREELDLYLLNANVSRMGLYIALLETGDTLPLDSLCSESGAVDATSFIRAARFGEVLAYHFPRAPGALWLEDAEIHRWQTERLADWWRVYRLRVRFDEQTRVFGVAE